MHYTNNLYLRTNSGGLGVCRCLQDHRQADNFTQGCQAEVEKYEQTASTDYRYLASFWPCCLLVLAATSIELLA